ncbi:glutathione S-transferase C-terminal-like protein [Atractiella rhizophila]|nr:glutathione S-transferase C-terminal-like protein [Atractiella rhizophila]
MSQPDITLYGSISVNPWKVAAALELLGVKYEHKMLNTLAGEQKQPEYTKLNPNGRVPAIVDHKNNNFTLWESNAILLYLVDRYDTDRKISAKTEEEKILQLQYLFFQASGQGPYFGQWVHFGKWHSEQIPSAIERYIAEIHRVLGVLEDILSKSKEGWLVGGRFTIADLAFLHWNIIPFNGPGYTGVPGFQFPEIKPGTYPNVEKWHAKIMSIEPIKKTLDEKETVMQSMLKKIGEK